MSRQPRMTGASTVHRVETAPVLRGRGPDMERASDALRSVLSGQPTLMVVSGEPGIGKTAFCRAVVDEAVRHGFLAAYGVAHDDDAVSPLASLGPALRFGPSPLIASADFMGLSGLLEQPLWLAEQLATLIEERAHESPLLIALDDAQWSDPLTRFVLRVLPKRLHESRIAWLVATRSAPGIRVADQVAEGAAPELPLVSIELEPLDDEALLAIARDRLGAEPDGRILGRVALGGGNPFLTVQVLEGLFEPEGADGTSQTRVPAGLSEGVRRRVGTTSRSCQRLLRTAAVLGQSFQLTDVAALIPDSHPADLTDALVEAINAGIVTDEGAFIVFRHELLREAIYEDLPPSARAAVHRAFAEHLLIENRGYAAAAPHVLVNASVGDSVAIDVLRKAAHEIASTMATTSVTFIRSAFELSRPDDPRWGEIGVETLSILNSAQQFDEAARFARMLLSSRISTQLHARVRLLLLPRLWAVGRFDEICELARDRADDQALDARLMAYRALATSSDAPESDDPIANVVAQTAAAERASADGERRLAHTLFVAARTLGDGIAGFGAPSQGQLAATELSSLARMDSIPEALAGLDDTTRFPSSWQAPQLSLLRAQFNLGAGEISRARSAAAKAAELMEELHDFALQRQVRLVLAHLALLEDKAAEARAQLAAATDSSAEAMVVRALLADADGDSRGARDVAEATASGPVFWPEEWLVAAACAAHRRGDDETVRLIATELAALADREPNVRGIVGSHLLVLGLMTGDFEPARNLLSETPRKMLITRADEEFGRFRLVSGDRAGAISLLDAVHDRYIEMGANAGATRVRRLLQGAGVRRRRWTPVPRRAESGWDALTEMERRVALLIAEGHSNRSAAEQLVLSPSTINTHLRAAFTKLDVHSRVQLAHVVLHRDGDAAPQP